MTPQAPTLRVRLRLWLAAAKANPLFAAGMMGAAAIALFDQAAKLWIVHGVKLAERPGRRIEVSGVFDLSYVQNYGASFGMLAGGALSRVILSAISLTVAGWLTLWLGRLDRRWAATGVAFIVGGAVGNLIDRVRLGYVVDFLDFSGLYFPWVFNVADAAINVGVACLLLDAWLTREKGGAAGRREN